jgi:two-component system copper resistance phosphate regulon response regulator CusR
MHRVFLAGHDPRIREAIADGLTALGYSVEFVHERGRVIAAARHSSPHIALVPWGGPIVQGRDVVLQLEADEHPLPMLILTDPAAPAGRARAGASAGVEGARRTREPFALAQIAQRLQLQMDGTLGKAQHARPSGGSQDLTTLRVADLLIERSTGRVSRAGMPINVTRREYLLLEYLALHADVSVTRAMIAREIWHVQTRATPLDNVIDVHVGRLRRKLTVPGRPELIHTIRRVGYRLSGQPDGGCSCN